MSTSKRSPFPPVFWIANSIEVLERFAYYGIYFGFGIYMQQLGFSRDRLGIIQSIFLLVSYTVPVLSGSFADRFGFKKMLIVSYLAYLPTILLLILTKSFSGIALTMLSIGFAAGLFKPLIAGTVRSVTDGTNKTLGYGIFYAMVNLGASFGPLVAGKLRAISWDYAFYAAAVAIAGMLLVTIIFYKEPPREREGTTLAQKLRDIGSTLTDVKFAVFLVMLGIFFWLPFWAFFNLCAVYLDGDLNSAALYEFIRTWVGPTVADFLSHTDEHGVRRILGETIAHTGWIIMVLQVPVSKTIEKFRALPTFLSGLAMMGIGFFVLGIARECGAGLAILGIALFAFGEMTASPRIQEYITWIAPKEKAGLYTGSNFLGTAIGGLTSGVIYTTLSGHFRATGHPEYVWYVLGVHMLVAVAALLIFIRVAGAFEERTE
jgi:proton-dependent oligopeptide transporter, POT family